MHPPNSNIATTEYEIHFAAQQGSFPASLADDLSRLGFRDDMLLTHGVVFSPSHPHGGTSCPLTGLHVTWDSFDRPAYFSQRRHFESLLNNYRDTCTGYAHAEVIQPEWDLSVNWRNFDCRVPMPVQPFDSVQSSKPKRWDIHVSADLKTLDPGLQSALFDFARMYYIDLQKRNGAVKRVFTIQGTNSANQGQALFHALVSYLDQAGGMSGSVKFEQTCYWATCGHPSIVPPVIHSFTLTHPMTGVAR